MTDEFTLKDVRAAIEVLEANSLRCKCGFDKVGWLLVPKTMEWECPECGVRQKGL